MKYNSVKRFVSGSADSGIAEQDQPSTSPELRVLQEVLETETVYVADLNEVIQVSYRRYTRMHIMFNLNLMVNISTFTSLDTATN